MVLFKDLPDISLQNGLLTENMDIQFGQLAIIKTYCRIFFLRMAIESFISSSDPSFPSRSPIKTLRTKCCIENLVRRTRISLYDRSTKQTSALHPETILKTHLRR